MTYRADEVGLSLRIEHLEKEVAELEGTRAGLRAALAEAVDRARVAQAKWKKAVRCETRAACCMECVTMMIVNF